MGLVALLHVGYSWTMSRTSVPCVAKQIVSHCTIVQWIQIVSTGKHCLRLSVLTVLLLDLASDKIKKHEGISSTPLK